VSDGMRDERNLLTSAGFDPTFVARAVSTPNKDMWLPATRELVRAHAVTAVAVPGQFAASGLGSNLDRDQLAAELKTTLPALRALEKSRSADYQAIVDAYYNGYLSGQTQTELNQALNRRLMPILQAHLPR
jgi:hypothetical protein